MLTDALPRDSASPRWHYLLQFTVVVALLGSFQLVMSANEAVGRGVGPKSFLLLRMALLVLLCTWILRRGGGKVGRCWPSPAAPLVDHTRNWWFAASSSIGSRR